MITDATGARDGSPVLALTRTRQQTMDQLCDWIRHLVIEHRVGRDTPHDPGPMAPHSHPHEH